MAARTWTTVQRQHQRDLIGKWRPWEKSTGPTSAEGKVAVAQNAYTGGVMVELRSWNKQMNAMMREQRRQLR